MTRKVVPHSKGVIGFAQALSGLFYRWLLLLPMTHPLSQGHQSASYSNQIEGHWGWLRIQSQRVGRVCYNSR